MTREDVDELSSAILTGLRSIDHAISADAGPGTDATGGSVNSLTEAAMGITAGLVKVADAINDLSVTLDGSFGNTEECNTPGEAIAGAIERAAELLSERES
jgi:hypothetical protein